MLRAFGRNHMPSGGNRDMHHPDLRREEAGRLFREPWTIEEKESIQPVKKLCTKKEESNL